MTRLGTSLSLIIYVASLADSLLAFAPSSTTSKPSSSALYISSFRVQEFLTEDGGVQKEVLFEGKGDVVGKGEVIMSYSGSLGQASWSPEEVVGCWLNEQQGLDHLKDAFLKEEIDEAKLVDAEQFTEDFVSSTLGVEAKIQCKKLVLAAKRLATTRSELPVGHVFDTNPEYPYELGSNKLIKGMEIGLATMKPGEWSIISIRSDYGYGSEGYRKPNGDVVVPPYASLNFEVQLYPEGVTDLEGYEKYMSGDEDDDDDGMEISFDEATLKP